MTTQEFDKAVMAFVLAYRSGETREDSVHMDNGYDEWLEENLDKFEDDDSERDFAKWKNRDGKKPRDCKEADEVEALWKEYNSRDDGCDEEREDASDITFRPGKGNAVEAVRDGKVIGYVYTNDTPLEPRTAEDADDGEWVTINGTHIHIGENGELEGKVGEKIEETSKGGGRERRPVNGKDISKTYNGDGSMADVLRTQGFDGLPQVVGQEEFDKAVAESSFIAQRVYVATSQEVLDAYRDSLYDGEWYVECTEGGSTFGKGMYTVSDDKGELTEDLQEHIAHYRYKYLEYKPEDEQFSYTETMTLAPGAKTISYDELDKRWRNEFDYLHEQDLIKEGEAKVKSDLENEVKERFGQQGQDIIKWYKEEEEKITYADPDASAKFNRLYAEHRKRMEVFPEKEREEFFTMVYDNGWLLRERFREYQRNYFKEANELREKYKDRNAYAAACGYDAVTVRHGTGYGYTVILNRSKVILLDGRGKKDSADRADDEGWVTINGTHTLIGPDGTAQGGGGLKGRSFSNARSQRRPAPYKRPEAQDKAIGRIIKRTANLKNEQFRIVDPEGNVVLEKRGGRDSVSATVGEKREHMEGNISIHNHPEGGTFSPQDLSDFGFGAREMVVSGPDGTYSLVNERYGTKDQSRGWHDMRDAIEREVPQEESGFRLMQQARENLKDSHENQEMKRINDTWLKMRESGASTEELNDYYNRSGYDDLARTQKENVRKETRRLEVAPFHDFYTQNAAKYGFRYTFTPHAGKRKKDSRSDDAIMAAIHKRKGMRNFRGLLSSFWINGNTYISRKLLDIIYKNAIIEMYGGDSRQDADPDAWVTLENGAHIPLNGEGEAIGGAGGWAEGKDFSEAKEAYEKGTEENPSAKGENVPCKGFKNKYAAKRHRKHWEEFGFTSDEEYEKAAIEFIKQPVGGNIDGYKRESGQIVRFNRKTGEMGIGTPGKELNTYFKARYDEVTGRVRLRAANNYFDRMKKEEAYEDD